MIYLDTSVALAHLLGADPHPPDSLWEQPVVSSRLLEYELWTRIHQRRLAASHGDAARDLLARVSLLELDAEVLARALEPFPAPVRTLDALHLATLAFLHEQGQAPRLATYDRRLEQAARKLGLAIAAW